MNSIEATRIREGYTIRVIQKGATFKYCGVDATTFIVDKKRISIKYALPVAERIVQMVEKDWECGN